MHPTEYTQIAADLIAIRDRLPEDHRLRYQANSCARVAFGFAASSTLTMAEDHSAGGWLVADYECVAWHDQDDRYFSALSGWGMLREATPATHIKLVWCRGDERRDFYLRVDSREHFDADFREMIEALR